MARFGLSRTAAIWLRLALLPLAVALLAVLFLTLRGMGLTQARDDAFSDALLRVQALESVLAKQRAVAAVLSDDDTVRAALAQGTDADLAQVSRKLERLHAVTQSSVIYLLDLDGTAVAASNWDEPISFVGSNYSFRDYFSVAIRDGQALQYALGSVSNRPGLYLSNRVDGAQGPLGVVVVKVEFDAIEASWARSSYDTHVTTATGEVVLSSDPATRFGPMPAAPPGVLAVTEPVPGAGWLLTLRYPAAEVNVTPALATAVAAALMLILWLWRGREAQARARIIERAANERRYRIDLEHAVEERTRDLSGAMHEREMAEQRLARMQADLVQANKLATLGQVTAGVAHEVNQPLATIRLLAENAQAMLPKRGGAEVQGNLARIVQMTDRIAQITTELRSFSRKATGRLEPVRVRDVIEASLLLTASRRRVEGARLVRDDGPQGLTVLAEAVRLEQILVNLIQNAQEALIGRPDPEIRIAVAQDGDQVVLTVSDNGPGLSPEIRANLFIPFSTSKPDGVGLGLVIAQGIARDFGGELTADPSVEGQGATFRLVLRAT